MGLPEIGEAHCRTPNPILCSFQHEITHQYCDSRLLEKDLEARLTVNEALQHPWLRADAAAPAPLLSSVVVERLRNFTRTTRLERLLLNVAANQLSNKDIDRLADMFRALDFDGDGCAQAQKGRKRTITRRSGCFVRCREQRPAVSVNVDLLGLSVQCWGLCCGPLQWRMPHKASAVCAVPSQALCKQGVWCCTPLALAC